MRDATLRPKSISFFMRLTGNVLEKTERLIFKNMPPHHHHHHHEEVCLSDKAPLPLKLFTGLLTAHFVFSFFHSRVLPKSLWQEG